MVTNHSQPQNPLALLRQLEWRVRHAVENILSGEYRSAFRGRGMEFDQVVRYEFGDDVRDIDSVSYTHLDVYKRQVRARSVVAALDGAHRRSVGQQDLEGVDVLVLFPAVAHPAVERVSKNACDAPRAGDVHREVGSMEAEVFKQRGLRDPGLDAHAQGIAVDFADRIEGA